MRFSLVRFCMLSNSCEAYSYIYPQWWSRTSTFFNLFSDILKFVAKAKPVWKFIWFYCDVTNLQWCCTFLRSQSISYFNVI